MSQPCENIDGQCGASWCDCDYQRRKRAGSFTAPTWLGGLRYFVLSGPMPPKTVYRMMPSGDIEMMMAGVWSASVTNQMTGLDEVSEGAARFIWERLLMPPKEKGQR